MADDEKLGTIPGNVYLAMGGQVFQVSRKVTKLGRQLDNNLVLQDHTVSRYHAEIRFEDGKFVVYDLGSTGGVFVNNKKVEKTVLHSGDIMMLANVPVMFILETSAMRQNAALETDKLSKPVIDDDMRKTSEKTRPIK